MTDREFDTLFTTDRPVVFAYHGYPWLIHRLTYRRANHDNFHVRGYKEEGTTTTPFDMVVLNQISRFHLAAEALKRARRKPANTDPLLADFKAALERHRRYIEEHMEDLPEIRGWTWT